MQEHKVQIRRPGRDEWEDIQYGEEIEIANILCHQCVGFDAIEMDKKDFYKLAVDCYREIVRKVGIVAGELLLPVFNSKGKVWFYVSKSKKRIEYVYTGETIYEG